MKTLWLFTLLIVAIATGVTDGADWKGKEVTKDGVLHVENPASPMRAQAEFAPSERWRIGGDDEDEDEFFGVIMAIDVDAEGNVYLLDAQLHQVMIYDSQGEFLRSVGREGEGPGEFRRPGDMVLLPGGNIGVVQQMPGKIVMLTPEGEPIDNHPFPEPKDGGTQMFFGCEATTGGVVVGVNQFAQREDGFVTIFQLTGVSERGELVAKYFTAERKHDMAKFEFDEKEISGPAALWGVGPDGRVYVNTVFDTYRVDVWRPDGTPDRVITRDYEPRVRTKEEKERASKSFRVVINGREAVLKTSETDRDVQRVYPRDDGSLWVLTSRGALDAADGVLGTFDVFDEAGRFVRQVSLGGNGSIERDAYFFVGDRMFVVTGFVSARRAMFGGNQEADEAEEAEPMAVICYDLGTELHGMSR
jgi:hypothetical protein